MVAKKETKVSLRGRPRKGETAEEARARRVREHKNAQRRERDSKKKKAA